MIGVGMKMNLQLIHFLLVEEEVAEMKDQDLYVIVTHTHTHTVHIPLQLLVHQVVLP